MCVDITVVQTEARQPLPLEIVHRRCLPVFLVRVLL
jgi:hypothetical protein